MSLLIAATLAGCASGGDVDLLESELRRTEDAIARLQYQLSTAEEDLRVARAETDMLQTQLAQRGRPASLLPEQSNVLFRVQDVKLHQYMSGGLDQDGQPGDEALALLVMPQDRHGELLKVPGGVQIDLFDMSLPPDSQKIGHWEFDAADTRAKWHAGIFGSGIMLELPWKALPRSNQLTVHAKLATADGREFHTTEQVRVTPPREAQIAVKPRPAIEAPPRLVPGVDGPDVPIPTEDEAAAEVTPGTLFEEADDSEGIPTSNNWTEETRPIWR